MEQGGAAKWPLTLAGAFDVREQRHDSRDRPRCPFPGRVRSCSLSPLLQCQCHCWEVQFAVLTCYAQTQVAHQGFHMDWLSDDIAPLRNDRNGMEWSGARGAEIQCISMHFTRTQNFVGIFSLGSHPLVKPSWCSKVREDGRKQSALCGL